LKYYYSNRPKRLLLNPPDEENVCSNDKLIKIFLNQEMIEDNPKMGVIKEEITEELQINFIQNFLTQKEIKTKHTLVKEKAKRAIKCIIALLFIWVPGFAVNY